LWVVKSDAVVHTRVHHPEVRGKVGVEDLLGCLVFNVVACFGGLHEGSEHREDVLA